VSAAEMALTAGAKTQIYFLDSGIHTELGLATETLSLHKPSSLNGSYELTLQHNNGLQ
jgi:hypothetical protein